MKVHLGCGREYLKGYVNVDKNKNIKADIYHDLSKGLPFKDGEVSEIVMNDFLEHIPRQHYWGFLDEINRVSHNGTLLKIFVPHYTGLGGIQLPCHHNFFGVKSFTMLKPETFNDDRYCDLRVRPNKVKLWFIKHNQNFWIAKVFNLINPIFNLGGEMYKHIWEKLNVFGFEEIEYELEVIKDE